ncbi:hypothetical protein [Aquiflexum sp.]|uniref:hypothetical protein n=1 Tax=Aquiflexum sp. TaxID=1872584 RepID=UPI0035933C51
MQRKNRASQNENVVMHRTHYQYLHYWLIIPFVITIIGFYNSYWSRFTETPLNWHLHGMSATVWYTILIIQPYLYTKGKIKSHRTFGIIGFLVAGFVAASALSVVGGHIKDLDPEIDSFIYPYRYSLSLTDFIYIAGFLFSIIMSIIHRKDIDLHSAWLISTVFWVLSPATDRFTFFVLDPFIDESTFWFNFESQFWISHIFIILILLFLIYLIAKHNRPWLPFALVALIHLIAPVLLIGLKDSEGLAQWFEHMYKPGFTD